MNFQWVLLPIYFPEFLEDFYPDAEEHDAGDDGDEAKGGSHKVLLVNDEVENKGNPTEGDQDGTEKMKHKPGENMNTFLPSNTENNHQAGTDTKERDQNHNDEHGIRVVEVDEEGLIPNNTTINKKKAHTERPSQQKVNNSNRSSCGYDDPPLRRLHGSSE